jgi:hypothetical protein
MNLNTNRHHRYLVQISSSITVTQGQQSSTTVSNYSRTTSKSKQVLGSDTSMFLHPLDARYSLGMPGLQKPQGEYWL